LKVLPFVKEATTYTMLRPFFKLTAQGERATGANGSWVYFFAISEVPLADSSMLTGGRIPLDFNSWEPALESPEFPGSIPAKAQVFSGKTHPHLKLDEGALVSIPRVQPGDQVFCAYR
jgi:hypothetical protein